MKKIILLCLSLTFTFTLTFAQSDFGSIALPFPHNPTNLYSNNDLSNIDEKAIEALNQGNVDKAINLYTQRALVLLAHNDFKNLGEVLLKIASLWNKQFLTEKTAPLLFNLYSLAQAFNDSMLMSGVHIEFAMSYQNVSQYDKAINNIQIALNFAAKSQLPLHSLRSYLSLAHLYNLSDKLDSAKIYIQKAQQLPPFDTLLNAELKIIEIENLALRAQADYKYLLDTLTRIEDYSNKLIQINKAILAAKIYCKIKDYHTARAMLYPFLPQKNIINTLSRELLITLLTCEYYILGDKWAIDIWEEATLTWGDDYRAAYALQEERFDNKFNTAYKEAYIKEQDAQLENISLHRRYYLVICIFIVILFGVIIFFLRSYIKAEAVRQENAILELQQYRQQLELDNYNKQLDPHEIKNIISAIAPQLQIKAPDAYKKMIKLFNITRASLNNGLDEALSIQFKQFEDLLQVHQNLLSTPVTYALEEDSSINIGLPRLMLKNLAEVLIKDYIKKLNISGHIILKVVKDNSFCYINLSLIFPDNPMAEKSVETLSQDAYNIINTYQKFFNILNEKNAQKASIIFDNKAIAFDVNIPLYYTYSI